MSMATQTILWFCELTLDVCNIQVLCPYTLEAGITTLPHDLSPTLSAALFFPAIFQCAFLYLSFHTAVCVCAALCIHDEDLLLSICVNLLKPG